MISKNIFDCFLQAKQAMKQRLNSSYNSSIASGTILCLAKTKNLNKITFFKYNINELKKFKSKREQTIKYYFYILYHNYYYCTYCSLQSFLFQENMTKIMLITPACPTPNFLFQPEMFEHMEGGKPALVKPIDCKKKKGQTMLCGVW